jgi:hypothetical protein
VTCLPKDTLTRRSVPALYVAWPEAGMRCSVQGCEPWTALTHPPGAYHNPKVSLHEAVEYLITEHRPEVKARQAEMKKPWHRRW